MSRYNSTNTTGAPLNLPQFTAQDKPGWLTDFNFAMEDINNGVKEVTDDIGEINEHLTATDATVARHEEDINGEHGLKQRVSDNQNRIEDLEEKVGDDTHGLVKEMADVQRDLAVTNTMAVKNKGAVDSIRDLICNPFLTTVQYEEGAYVYVQDSDDGEIHYYKANQRHKGAFNPAHFDDVTDKLITALDNSGGGGGSQYTLPIAGNADDTDPVLGGVIVGDGLTIDPNTGVLSAEGGGSGDIPKASTVTYGKVKIDEDGGINVNDGVISAKVDNDTIIVNENGELESTKKITPSDVPDATYVSKGLVQIDSTGGLEVNGGVISTNIDDDYIKLTAQGKLTVNPEKIGGAAQLNAGDGIDIDHQTNTITSKVASPNERGSVRVPASEFYKSNGDELHLQLKPNGGIIRTNEGFAVDGGGGTTYGAGVGIDIDSNNDINLLPPQNGEIGGVKAGSGVSISSDGTISATGGGGSTYTEGDGIDITNDEISVKLAANNPGLEFDANGGLKAIGGGSGSISEATSDALGGVYADSSQYHTDEYNDLIFVDYVDETTLQTKRGTKVKELPATRELAIGTRQLFIKGYVGGVSGLGGDEANPDDVFEYAGPTTVGGVTIYGKGNLLKAKNYVSDEEAQQAYSDYIPSDPTSYKNWLSDNFDVYQGAKNLIMRTITSAPLMNEQRDPTDTRKIPYQTIMTQGAFSDVGGTSVYPNVSLNNIFDFTIPDTCKNQPLVLFFPLQFTLTNHQVTEDTLVNKADLSGNLFKITYRVTLGSDQYGASYNIPIFTKEMFLRPSILENKAVGDVILVKDVIGRDGNAQQGVDARSDLSSACMIYPSNFKRIWITATLERVDLTTGTVRRYCSWGGPDGAEEASVGAIALDGNVYVYNLGERTTHLTPDSNEP